MIKLLNFFSFLISAFFFIIHPLAQWIMLKIQSLAHTIRAVQPDPARPALVSHVIRWPKWLYKNQKKQFDLNNLQIYLILCLFIFIYIFFSYSYDFCLAFEWKFILNEFFVFDFFVFFFVHFGHSSSPVSVCAR